MADQIVPDIQRMKPHGLRHRTDLAAQLAQVQVAQVAPVVIHRTRTRAIDAERQAKQGALAGPGLAGDRDEFPGLCVNRDIIENQRAIGIVAKRDAVKQQVPAQVFHRLAFGLGFGNGAKQRAHLLEGRYHGSDHAEGIAEACDRALESDEDQVDNKEVTDRHGPLADAHGSRQQDRGCQKRQGCRKRPRMALQCAQIQFRAFLLAVIPGPHGVRRAFGIFHSQLGKAADDLEQAAGHGPRGTGHASVRGHLQGPERRGDQQRGQAESQGEAAQGRIVVEDDGKHRGQEDERQETVGDQPLQAVSKILEGHSRHRQIT